MRGGFRTAVPVTGDPATLTERRQLADRIRAENHVRAANNRYLFQAYGRH